MNIKEKQLTEEFSQGWAARSDLKPLSSCPFEKNTEEASLWCYGWYEAHS